MNTGDQMQPCRDWARRMLEGCVVLDTETTGLYDAEIVQIALVDHAGAVLIDTLVQPQEPERLLARNGRGICAADIHGIRPEHLVGAPAFDAIYGDLFRLLRGRELVIYNADYDLSALAGCGQRYLLPAFDCGVSHCAMRWYARFWGDWNERREDYRWQPLGDACRQQGVVVDAPAHSALGDSLATLGLLRAMAREPC